ncbi:cyclopropane-fatty-acyl-phospholipid synthase family protein [soil metagenome]
MSATATQRAARRAGHALLRRITGGLLEVTESGETLAFGDPSAGLRASVEVRDPAAWTSLMRGSTGYAEGYVEELWHTEDLVAVIQVTARAMRPLDRLRKRWQPVIGRAQRIGRLVPRNTHTGARTNIAAHYDIGNDLFTAFLDRQLVYSSAYFETPETSLEAAQDEKLDRICRQLELDSDDHLVEIGTGWGAMAIYAAREYGCRVTTTTISKEQRAYALERVEAEGLSDLVTVLDRDYRDLRGKFTKLVSIEMIEAVGWQYFETFFRKCSSLLTGDGLMALQAIVIEDDLYELEKASRSFANTHIFPGGCLPSERLINEMVARHTDMAGTLTEDITPHYAETLRIWRERFNDSVPQLVAEGYDARFQRLWNFYLAFSEGGFREQRIRDLQMVFAKPAAARANAEDRGRTAVFA